ncbi:cyclin [Mycena floridula]|nr:cyclin [Mycena floridula]
MATNHARLPPRRVIPQRKADENATSRHVRQHSGIPVGPSRLAQKEPIAGKNNLTRTALVEVTTTAINRKENASRLIVGKDKEEVGLKRPRSNSSATENPRPPLAQKTHFGQPGRVALARSRQLPVASRRLARVVPEPVVVIEEDDEDAMEEDEDEMDVEDEVGLHRDHDMAERQVDDESDGEESDTSLLDGEREVEDMMGVEEDEQLQEDSRSRVWPNITPSRDAMYQKKVEAIREVFEDIADDCDPSMVSEYADDIFKYMAELETEVLPVGDYMSIQPELTWDMRESLVDWLLQVHIQYHMLPETLWIAINIMDRFLSSRAVSRVKLQLVGVASMFIACKYEEILAPSIDEFVSMTNGAFDKEDLLKGERIVLQVLGFHVSHYCSPYSWMRKISKADDYDLQTRTLSKFLTEVTLMDHRFLTVKPSLVAAVGMYSARMMLEGDWNEAFVYHSGFTEEQLTPGHQFIVEKLSENGFTNLFIYKKYSHKKFLKASSFAVQWARTRTAAGEL